MLCNRLYIFSIFPTCLYDICCSMQLGNSCNTPWPPCNSGTWWIHIPMYWWYVTSVKKKFHWWLAHPEVFLHHSVWARGWQTPKYTGTLPFVPWVIYRWKGAYSAYGYFRSPAIIAGPYDDTVQQWVLISITQNQYLQKGGINMVEAISLSGGSEEKHGTWNNTIPLMDTVLCPCCVDPLCPIWWSKDILKAFPKGVAKWGRSNIYPVLQSSWRLC